MTIELDELAVRAANDPAPAGSALREVIVSVIETTRRHWEIASGRNASGAIADSQSRPHRFGLERHEAAL